MKRVLIVDDERLILDGLAKSLSSEDLEIKIAGNGKDAINEISSCFYHLCFLDVYLPDINGVEVMKKIKEISPKTKIVIMTAHHITGDMRKDIEDNAFHFIGKPFDLSQIKIISELALGHYKSIQKEDASLGSKTQNGRQFERTPLIKAINYFAGVFEGGELKMLNLKGDIIDISEGGVGLKTDYPLEPGYMIRFPAETKHSVGIVKWSMPIGSGSYRAGVEFVKYTV